MIYILVGWGSMYIAALVMIEGINEMNFGFLYGKQYLSEKKARIIVNIVKDKLIELTKCNPIKSKL